MSKPSVHSESGVALTIRLSTVLLRFICCMGGIWGSRQRVLGCKSIQTLSDKLLYIVCRPGPCLLFLQWLVITVVYFGDQVLILGDSGGAFHFASAKIFVRIRYRIPVWRMTEKKAPFEQLIQKQLEKNNKMMESAAYSGGQRGAGRQLVQEADNRRTPAAQAASTDRPVTSVNPPAALPTPILKVKLAVAKDGRIMLKPSNKIVFSILSKLPNTAYSIQANEWTFDEAHYATVCAEMLKNKIVFEKIPPGTLALLRKSIPDEKFVLEGEIYDKLMKFQRAAVLFALNRNGRVLLADDMGLGKTIQALAIAHFYRLEYPLLVVAPASLLSNWTESFQRFLNEEATVIKQRSDFGNRVSVVSYNQAVVFLDAIRACNFGVVICDECHYLKSMTSKRTKGLLPILQRASRLVMISGTPAMSRPLELYPILAALDKTVYPNFAVYGARYCDGRKVQQYYDYRGCSNAAELALVIEKAFMIRRLKKSVLDELPSKFRRQVVLETSKRGAPGGWAGCPEEIAESTTKNEFANAANIKKEPVLKYIEMIAEKDVKAVVFAHHQVMLDGIEDFCKEKKILYIRIDGSTPAAKRHGLVESFQTDEAIRMAVLSLTACSAGLTLTAGKAVIFAELYWNPGTLLQAEDRIHRIGQEDSVDIHYLVAKGTIDEMVWPYLLKKLNVLESLGIGKNELKFVKSAVSSDVHQKRLDGFIKK